MREEKTEKVVQQKTYNETSVLIERLLFYKALKRRNPET